MTVASSISSKLITASLAKIMLSLRALVEDDSLIFKVEFARVTIPDELLSPKSTFFSSLGVQHI